MSEEKGVTSLFIVIGICLIVLGNSTIHDNKASAIDYNEMKLSDLAQGTIVEGNILVNLGCFDKEYEKESAAHLGKKYYYFAVFVDNSLVAIKVRRNSRVARQLEKQRKSIEANYDGEIKYLSSETVEIPFRGKITEMNFFMEERLKESVSVDGLPVFNVQPYVIESVMTDEDARHLIVAGVLCIIIPIMFGGIIKRIARKIYEESEETESPNPDFGKVGDFDFLSSPYDKYGDP